MRFHDLRHSYAVMCIENGIDIKTISESMGHFSVAFTLDVYVLASGEKGHFASGIKGHFQSGLKGQSIPLSVK